MFKAPFLKVFRREKYFCVFFYGRKNGLMSRRRDYGVQDKSPHGKNSKNHNKNPKLVNFKYAERRIISAFFT
jgi:hypothetical protein